MLKCPLQLLINTWNLLMQERLIKGTGLFVHENSEVYNTVEELWDGE